MSRPLGPARSSQCQGWSPGSTITMCTCGLPRTLHPPVMDPFDQMEILFTRWFTSVKEAPVVRKRISMSTGGPPIHADVAAVGPAIKTHTLTKLETDYEALQAQVAALHKRKAERYDCYQCKMQRSTDDDTAEVKKIELTAPYEEVKAAVAVAYNALQNSDKEPMIRGLVTSLFVKLSGFGPTTDASTKKDMKECVERAYLLLERDKCEDKEVIRVVQNMRSAMQKCVPEFYDATPSNWDRDLFERPKLYAHSAEKLLALKKRYAAKNKGLDPK